MPLMNANRRELMSIIRVMSTWQIQGLYVLLTSRREGDIKSRLKRTLDDQNTSCIQSDVVDHYIRLYVHQRLADGDAFGKWKTDDKILVEKSLTERACGMYQHINI
jgi:hypothetical protein